jgi:hypothetical protein
MMEFPNEARVPRKAPKRGIADLDVMARQAENRDGFPRGRAGTLGDEHPERLCGMINHVQSLLHPLPLSLILMTHLLPPPRLAGAAMQRNSWTNNP